MAARIRLYAPRTDSADTPEKIKARLKKEREKIDAKTIGNTIQKNQAYKGAEARYGEDAPDHQRGEGKRKTLLILPKPHRLP
jgi:hypothetical protein